MVAIGIQHGSLAQYSDATNTWIWAGSTLQAGKEVVMGAVQ
jgi:hypothetical protein